ncbi:magnesium and cobalt transport protein CorA [Jiangella rhizosphaerae]|uniref:Magnesium and cobalt transport protein CorA n=1 Tax=Jiangella rhizosphaerae TaxID=2293569 RepID=A0A418KJE8_9ACTN|nr:magnesium and cobalt transport protein CorA [Jiangella rhizosphaerae]RIQ14364.1 magnesium and cobalt transport protein CorA [Jiangella rhizosphaerae]
MTVSDWAFYRGGRRQTGEDYDGAVAAARERQGFVWVRLHEPAADNLRRVAADFGLHPLAVDDAMDERQGTKLGHYDGLVYLVLRRVRYDGGVRDAGRLTVLAGPDVVVTVSEGDPDPVASIAARLEDQPKLLGHGPAAVLYAAAGATVDEYTETAEAFEADLTEIEAAVFDDVSGNQASRIYHAKRQLLKLQRSVGPLGLPVRSLTERAPELIPVKVQTYFRGVGDHVERLRAQLNGYDEIISSMLQANLAQLSVAQNNDMRKITSWAAIIAVPTAIAGIYGMNFRDMPELHWSFGYPAVMVLMAGICWALYVNFKRRNWL